eukprot:1670009-Rhodomonas_salina.1
MENGGISDEKSLGRGCVSTPPRILDKVHSSDRHALCCFPSFSWRLKICGFLRPQWGIGCPSKSIRRLCCLVAVCKDRKRSVSSRCDGRNRRPVYSDLKLRNWYKFALIDHSRTTRNENVVGGVSGPYLGTSLRWY